jgi:hypothetical protein
MVVLKANRVRDGWQGGGRKGVLAYYVASLVSFRFIPAAYSGIMGKRNGIAIASTLFFYDTCFNTVLL